MLTDLHLSPILTWLTDFILHKSGKPLFFTDGQFLLFILLFLAAHTMAMKHAVRRMHVILLFSLWFYYKSAGIMTLVLVAVAAVTYGLALLLEMRRGTAAGKIAFYSGLLLLAGNLAFFKYTPFFSQFGHMISIFDLRPGAVLFPVGLSFYTFSNIAYLVDVKRGKHPPERSFTFFLTFVSFFPVVQMGPIERFGSLGPQLRRQISLTREDVGEGFFLILSGAIKKMVIGDFINHQLVQNVFSMPDRFTGMENLAALLGYSLVIYCDFSGYTDMGRGIARWMGIKAAINFNFPYKSHNIGEFWRRWHISLSSWLRDYLFMPVAWLISGISSKEFLIRGRYLRTDLVIFTGASMFTFFICGLWHGSGVNFILWGLMHGTALSVQKIWNVNTKFLRKERSPRMKSLNQKLGIILTFSFVTATWAFFRMDSPAKSLQVFQAIGNNFAPGVFPAFILAYYPALLMMLSGYTLHFAPEKFYDWLRSTLKNMEWYWKSVVAMAVTGVILWVQSLGSAMPIYIQF